MGALARLLQDSAFTDGCLAAENGEAVVRLVLEAESRNATPAAG
jgi:hypothetical protein